MENDITPISEEENDSENTEHNFMSEINEMGYFSIDDLYYRALNRLKNAKVNGCFEGELSIKINRNNFCNYCLLKDLIRYSTVEEDMELITISECKEFLKANSLKTTGTKPELVHRIVLSEPSFFGAKHYIITTKGLDILQHFWKLRALLNAQTPEEIFRKKIKKYDISYQKYLDTKNEIPFKASVNDVIWGILNERTLEYSYKKSYMDLRNNYFNMGCLLEEEKTYDRALEYFLMATCFDVNGYKLQDFAITHGPTLTRGLANRIYYLRSHYSPDIAQIAYSQCNIEKYYFTEMTFVELINDIVTSDHRLSYAEANELIQKYVAR